MRIDRDGDDVSMVLNKQDMIDLKNMFDSHMMIPKYSMFGKSGGQQVIATSSMASSSISSTIPSPPIANNLWPGVKNWYNAVYSSSNPHLPQPAKPEDSFEILGKLIRAFDLILENKETEGKEIE